jgi:DNA-binding LacI/PurR family transcriptional regulator
MVETYGKTSQIPSIMDEIERDIRHRGLHAGERYLTAEEMAENFDVSIASINRAMQVMARRNILVRKRRHGTFIGPAINSNEDVVIKSISFFTQREYRGTNNLPPNSMVDGILSELPQADIHFVFLPPGEEIPYVRKAVENAQNNGELSGAILHCCPRNVYKFFYEKKIPAVAVGSDPNFLLPWLDKDQRQAGQILAEYLMEKGHNRIAFLKGDIWWPGDSRASDGIAQALGSAGKPADAMQTRGIPPDKGPALKIIQALFDQETPPTGFICRSRFVADCAAEVAQERGRKVQDEVDITCACDSTYIGSLKDNIFPYLKGIDPHAYGCLFSKLLAQRIRGEWPSPDHYETPVSLCLPEINLAEIQ